MSRTGFNQALCLNTLLRVFSALLIALLLVFLVDNTLMFWLEWPGIKRFVLTPESIGDGAIRGLIQFVFSLGVGVLAVALVVATPRRQLDEDAELYSRISAFIVRAAFWAIFLVGVVDMAISFLRVEGMLGNLVGERLETQLGRPVFRGTWIHVPLIITSILIASVTRSLGFIWLALLIVAAEFTIVISRFVFSYEQAFMGDLVRFWYAGLFLFASAYTLTQDGHVRVDVIYANLSQRGKALTNIFGSLFLGLPLCWNILIQGTSSKASSINSPLLNFEISQSGFGMYTKYLMAAYLLIFAVSMAIQFTSYLLSNAAIYQDNRPLPSGRTTAG